MLRNNPLSISPWKKALAFSSSLAMGFSAGITMASSVFSQSKNILVSAITGSITGIGSVFRFYAFNGKSIMNAEEEADFINLNYSELEHTIGDPSCSTGIAQSLFTSFSLATNLANRYFILTTLLKLFEAEISLGSFIAILVLDTLLKQFFDMSNEVYECNTKIAEKIDGHTSIPVYGKLFKPFTNNTSKKIFNICGSLEHTLIDDLIPWIGFIPQDSIRYLKENEDARNTVLAITAAPSLLLLVIVFIQTYYFEGKHTEKHFAEIEGRNREIDEKTCPLMLLKTLKIMLLLMGPFHGSAASLPVYVTINEMSNTDSNTFNPYSFTVTLLVFILATLGTHYSEVRESQAAMSKKILKAIERARMTDTETPALPNSDSNVSDILEGPDSLKLTRQI